MGSSSQDLETQAGSVDEEALTQLLEEHGPSVYQRVAGRIPQRFRAVLSAEDVMQQAFMDAFLRFREFVPYGEGSFGGWLATIAERNLGNALKMLEAEKRGKGRRKVELISKDDSLVALYELVGAVTSTPSRRAARSEACAAVRWALGALPEDYQQVVELYDLAGQSAKEVGQILGRSPGAVYMMRARAHDRLSEILGSASKFISRG